MAKNDKGQNIILPFEEQRVLYRSDTHAPLSVVSQRFQEVQPHSILEFYRDLTEQSGFELETAGVLKGGKKFWALARTGQSTALKGKDVSHGYILLATACDGTLATTAQFTSIRVVCNNTLAIALRSKENSSNVAGNVGTGVVKVPHSTRFDAEKVKQQLGISVRGWDEHMYQMKQLSQRKVNQTQAAAYFEAVFNNTNLTVMEQEDSIIQFYQNVAAKSESKSEPNDRALSKVMRMFNGQGRGAELSSAKDTAYGLLCAVTEYCDHERRAMSQDHRLDSTWFGMGAAIKQRGLEQALRMIA